MLFNFRLAALEQVKPWGEPPSQRLHWFGLTDGQYWLQVGKDALFEYSEAARQKSGCPRYCSYQVVRLYEDVLEIVSDVLEPVPSDISPYLNLDRRMKWGRAYNAWAQDAESRLPEDQYWESIDVATSWIGERTLDSAYLTPSTRIQLWSDGRDVHVEWDNRDKLIEGVEAWTATAGSYAIPIAAFIAEVQSFHDRLMAQMFERVGSVRAGRLPENVEVDIGALAKEHEQRAKPVTRYFLQREEKDWKQVREVIEEIKKYGLASDESGH